MATKKITSKTKSPLRVGAKVFIRTVTMHLTGEVVELGEHEIVLKTAAWIAESGRFAAALATGVLSEVEVIPGFVAVGRGSIVDVSEWAHPLPTKTV